MVDTVRTLAALQALLADNTTGDISPQDVRDVLLSSVTLIPDYPTGLNAADIYWSGSDAAAMTTVTVTGSQTLTERTGMLSVLFSGQGAQDYNAVLKAHTFSVGDSFAVPLRLMETIGTSLIAVAGVVFTDGTASTSNAVMAGMMLHGSSSPQSRGSIRRGTLTAMSASTDIDLRWKQFPWLWLRLTYVAANTWRIQLSPDGISWSTFGAADPSFTMTPTHVGLAWSKENSAGDGIATFGPILKLA